MSAPPLPHCYRHPNREAGVRCTRCDRPICPECMRPASVGFHCPDDVALGRREQRQPRNAVGVALRQSPPYVTAVLLALNIAAYAITGLQSPGGLNDPGRSTAFQDFQLYNYAVGHDSEFYRLITSGFLHASLLHIGSNMLSLVFVGPALEQMLGRWRFAAVYGLSLLGGSAAVYAFGPLGYAAVGASGALFGLFGVCLALVRRLGLDLQWIVAIIVLNFAFTFSVPGISKQAHIGGFVTGILAGLAIGGLPNSSRRVPTRLQVYGLVAIGVLLAVVIAVHTGTGDF